MAAIIWTPEKPQLARLQLLEEGADIIDVGGESTRPGASVAVASPPQEIRNHEAKQKQEDSNGQKLP
jgi:hypothetical protein